MFLLMEHVGVKLVTLVHFINPYIGTECESTDLVPGDLVNLSGSQLTLVPSDMFLLSGDAIINESMLTGESIPVSKVSAKDDDIHSWIEGKEENPKTFLYSGTRVIRARGILAADNHSGKPAFGVVTRTGGNRILLLFFSLNHDTQVSIRPKVR